jgi:hypothetical protein
MKKMKYVKSKGRFWNRDILERVLATLKCILREVTKKMDELVVELLNWRFRVSGGVSPILLLNHQSSCKLHTNDERVK